MLTCLLQSLPLGLPLPPDHAFPRGRRTTELFHRPTPATFHLRPCTLPLFLPAGDRTFPLMCSPSPSNSPTDCPSESNHGAAKLEEEEEICDQSGLESAIKFVADIVKQFLVATAWAEGLLLHFSWLNFGWVRVLTVRQPNLPSIMAMLLLIFQSVWMASWLKRVWKIETKGVKKKSCVAEWGQGYPTEKNAREITRCLWWILFFHNLFGNNSFPDFKLMIYVMLCDLFLEKIFFAWKGLV